MYIVIAGAGLIGGELARRLLRNKHDVVVIEPNKAACDRTYAETGVIAVNGSAANIDILKEAGIAKADVAVAATGVDADNLAFAILAKSFGVTELVVRMRDAAYENAYRVAGVNTIVRVTDLLISQMLIGVERPSVRNVTTIGGGRGSIFVITVPKGAKVAGRCIKDIAESRRFPSECVFIALYNKERDEFSIPRGQGIVGEGDELFLISTADDIKTAADFLTATK